MSRDANYQITCDYCGKSPLGIGDKGTARMYIPTTDGNWTEYNVDFCMEDGLKLAPPTIATVQPPTSGE